MKNKQLVENINTIQEEPNENDSKLEIQLKTEESNFQLEVDLPKTNKPNDPNSDNLFGSYEYDVLNVDLEKLKGIEQQVNDMLSKELEEDIKQLQIDYKNTYEEKLKKEEERKKLEFDKIHLQNDYETANK